MLLSRWHFHSFIYMPPGAYGSARKRSARCMQRRRTGRQTSFTRARNAPERHEAFEKASLREPRGLPTLLDHKPRLAAGPLYRPITGRLLKFGIVRDGLSILNYELLRRVFFFVYAAPRAPRAGCFLSRSLVRSPLEDSLAL